MIDQMDSAIRCGQMLLASEKGPRRGSKAYLLLKRLFEKASEVFKDGKNSYEFNWKDIAQDSEVHDEGKQLKRNLTEAIDIWSKYIEVVKEIAVDNDFSHIPILKQISKGAGAGVMNRYAVCTEFVNKSGIIAKDDIPAGYIRYTPELIDRPTGLGKLVNGLLAKRWVWKFLIGSVAVAIGVAAITVWYGLWSLLVQNSIFGLVQTVITTLLALFVLYVFFSPLYYCATRRIIMAPVLMSTSMMHEAQLEYIKLRHVGADGRQIRQFRLVSYAANCQMCGDRINVHNGSLIPWGRLIGCCARNPVEHIYSFDHVTRLGRLIYPEYANLADVGYRLVQDESGDLVR